VLFHANDPQFHFSNFYVPAWDPLPYVGADILAFALQYIFPIDIAGRLILSLCVASLSYAIFLFLKKSCPENLALAPLGLFLVYNPNFLMGSIGNQLSVAACLIVMSVWIAYCASPRLLTAVCFSAGLIVVYLFHLIGFAVAGVVVGVYTLFQEERWKKLVVLLASSLPSLMLFILHPGHEGTTRTGTMRYTITVFTRLRHLIFPLWLFTWRPLDIAFIASLVLILLILFLVQPRIRVQSVWLTISCVLILISFAIPDQYGSGGFVDLRIISFIYFFVLPVFRFERIPRSLLIAISLLVAFRIAVVEYMFLAEQHQLSQLTSSFEAIPRDSKVLQLERYGGNTGYVWRGELHHLQYGMIQRGFLLPSLFHIPGVQPIRMVTDIYYPNISYDVDYTEENTDWEKIAQSYDYLWVPTNPEISKLSSSIGDPIYSNDSVTVYRIRK
jgi:hypothetical protein